MIALGRTLSIFARTFYYYLISHLPKASVTSLKQQWATSIMSEFGYQINVEGERPGTGAKILVGNHISYLDIMLLMAVHPEIVFIAKKEVSSWPVIGLAAARVGTIFVDRENRNDRSQKRSQIAEALKKNGSQVVVFPSGTTTLDENVPWKKGIFEIAHENEIPVKMFKISYSPLRESAYIDEDNLLTQMQKLFSIKSKTATLKWLDEHQIHSPLAMAESLRKSVI